MPIEFRCVQCSKLLRTPDESAGKKAKCPQCGTIVDVPDSALDPHRAAHVSGQLEPNPANPFSEPTVPQSTGGESWNPYASPGTSELPPLTRPALAELNHRYISFDEVLRKSWALCRDQLGQVALCGLLYLAISMGVGMVNGILQGIAEATGQDVVKYAVTIVEQLAGFAVNTFLQLGMLLFGLRLARTGTARVSDLFAAGPFYPRGLLLFFVITLIFYGSMLVCLIPALVTIPTAQEPLIIGAFAIFGILALGVGTYVMLRMTLAGAFLLDQDTSVTEALRLSDRFMTGNKVTTFLLGLVTGLIGMLVVLVTCCIGSVVVVPFIIGILNPTIYLLATGQAVHDPQAIPRHDSTGV